MKEIISFPIGIIDVLWDYDDYHEIKKAFYEFIISNNNNKFEFKNNYYFLKNNMFLQQEDTSTNTLKVIILEINDNKIKIQICGDILWLTQEQYNLFNENITKLNDKWNFNIDIKNNSKSK